MSIEIQDIHKRFGSFQALRGVELSVRTGELVALLGPSGSGKTTLLRIIAGLEHPDAGNILVHGEDATFRRVRERGVGFVFQHYALFKHMSVLDNVAFGLRVKPRRQRLSKAAIHERVNELLSLVQIEGLAARFPAQLSGGQRQRVALARALITEPTVLLLDEPFGALDAKVRKELRRWLRRLHHDLHVTSVFVTHDQEEALEVADRVVVMNAGRIEQVGTPEEVYEQPTSPFVCEFLGDAVRLPSADGSSVRYVRSHDWELSHQASGDDVWAVRLEHAVPVGNTVRLLLKRERDGEPLEVETSKAAYHALDLAAEQRFFARPRISRHFTTG